MTQRASTLATNGLSAVGLSLGLAYSAKANPMLPVTNIAFNQLTNPLT